jgi:hypothetical protein
MSRVKGALYGGIFSLRECAQQNIMTIEVIDVELSVRKWLN